MNPYDHIKIEKKWQKKWESSKPNKVTEDLKKKKFYALIEFPYPSGAGLHIGHIRSNTAMDIISRKRRREGYNVLYPIGWDAFGLPTENYAIKTGIQPKIVTKQNTDTFRRQLKSLGLSFDWSREVDTTDPKYYKWTQWIFLQLLKKGLAYKKKMTINWCPKDLIGLANEEVVNGCCERCGTKVEKKEKEQWMLAITKYAERLDKDLDETEFLEKIKIQQRNWIGKSEGAEIEFPFIAKDKKLRFVIIHGFEGSAKTNFIPWLKKELEGKGYEVETPELPNSFDPKEEEQVAHVLKTCKLDEDTVVIGHSLGAIVAMKALMKFDRPISGLLLVAAAIDPAFIHGDEDSRKYAKGFSWDIDYSKIQKLAQGRIAVLSDLKEPQRMPYLKYLSEKLRAALTETESVEEHFCAEKEPEILKGVTPTIKVFTTRPDTLFGVTYVVLAPEHEWVSELLSFVKNPDEVKAYIQKSKSKTDIERTDAKSQKTGVELKGIIVTNPATKEEIPVYIADYVLADYGTGAVMAVPAHDERDADFAKKYNLPVKTVIEPMLIKTDGADAVKQGVPFVERRAVVCIIKHWSEDKYLMSFYKVNDWKGFVVGGLENNETAGETGAREIHEETGYKNARFVRDVAVMHSQFYHPVKNVNRFAHFNIAYFELANGERDEMAEEEKKLHDVVWLSPKEVSEAVNRDDIKYAWETFNGDKCYTGEGLLANSGKFDGKSSDSVKKEITEFVGGTWVTKFKLRDWVFSRQRYWGEPIPVVHCEKCGIVSLPEKDLPLELPKVKNYAPTATGESPLAVIDKWVNTKCPQCKGKAKRETDTMPNWAGSSWYYLRYTDPKNKKAFADKKNIDYWTPVDWYNGGMEHTTLHLLYSRFWHKFLFDLGLVPTSEPYKKRTSHGLILAEDGEKISKSKGNGINPDDIVKTVGADTLRIHEMFLGPFDQAVKWDSNSIAGSRRFIERIWKLRERIGENSDPKIDTLVHKTIKKVSDDIEDMKFNTAISSLMILVNDFEKEASISKENYSVLVQLVAPFAPHVAEELWTLMKNKGSIHAVPWPQHDPAKLVENVVIITIQVNGKMRGRVECTHDASDEEVKNMALNMTEIKKWVDGKDVKKVIFVKGKLINFVV